MFLYITNDKIGSQTGGGIVTRNELEALSQLGPVDVVNPQSTPDPFLSEEKIEIPDIQKYKLAHFYSGTFPKLVKKLKANGVKVTYTVAAHDVDLSREEFNGLGMSFGFEHLNNPELFKKYLSSYVNSDVVICPSKVAEKTNKKYGCSNTKIIPHGCDSMTAKKFPEKFNVGYLGQIGPDKGLRYLLEAWSSLNYKDAILNIAGAQSPYLIGLIRYFGKGNINLMGYVKNVEDLYNACSVYVQPSVTEGFGIEVLEAMNCGRPVIVSDGAGAADCVGVGCNVFPKRDVGVLAELIDWHKNNPCKNSDNLIAWSKNYSWDKVREQYITVWKNLIK